MDLIEEWKPIAGFCNYEVSNLGNVRHKQRKKKNLVIMRDFFGWVKEYIYLVDENKKRRKCAIEYLVAPAFLEEPENDRWYVRHISGILGLDKHMKRASNLKYMYHTIGVKSAIE